PEQSADTDVGIEIAAAAGPVRQSFIISKLWTIEAKLHEPRERNNAARLNLAANNFTQPVHAGSPAAAHPRVVGPCVAGLGLSREAAAREGLRPAESSRGPRAGRACRSADFSPPGAVAAGARGGINSALHCPRRVPSRGVL